MTHPITPPPELVQQWGHDANLSGVPHNDEHWAYEQHIATRAATWGAQYGGDQELEACCGWLEQQTLCGHRDLIPSLRAARRPKLSSLKQQALGALSRADKDALTNPLTGEVVALRTILNKEQSDTIRRALQALPE